MGHSKLFNRLGLRAGSAPVELPFTMPDDGTTGSREAPGLRKAQRMSANKLAYCRVDPDTLADCGEPPAHVQAALEDVLGPELLDEQGEARLKLRLHPHFKRWCLYEREFIPSWGENLWRCFWICQEDPSPGYLPPDLRGDPYLAHFTGVLGNYREPTREDFECLERFNIRKYGVEAVNEYAGEDEERLEASLEAAEVERTEAFLDDNWFQVWDEANEAAGSGHKMRSSACDALKGRVKELPSLWRRTQKNGYVLVERKTKEEWLSELDADKREAIEIMRQESERRRAERAAAQRAANAAEAAAELSAAPQLTPQQSQLTPQKVQQLQQLQQLQRAQE